MVGKIKETIMKRDGICSAEADSLIKDAVTELKILMKGKGVFIGMDICSDYFGLEADYLDELIEMAS